MIKNGIYIDGKIFLSIVDSRWLVIMFTSKKGHFFKTFNAVVFLKKNKAS